MARIRDSGSCLLLSWLDAAALRLVNGRLDLDLDIVEVKDLGRRLGVEVGEFGDERVDALGADRDLTEHANLRGCG